MWCDAMLVLIHSEWPRARDQLLAPSTSSSHAVVQAWMQATQVQVRGARSAISIPSACRVDPHCYSQDHGKIIRW